MHVRKTPWASARSGRRQERRAGVHWTPNEWGRNRPNKPIGLPWLGWPDSGGPWRSRYWTASKSGWPHHVNRAREGRWRARASDVAVRSRTPGPFGLRRIMPMVHAAPGHKRLPGTRFCREPTWRLPAKPRAEGSRPPGAAVPTPDSKELKAISLAGRVTTGMIGADFGNRQWTLGLAVATSRGEGVDAGPSGQGDVEAQVSGIYPYAGYRLKDCASGWLAAIAPAAWLWTPRVPSESIRI